MAQISFGRKKKILILVKFQKIIKKSCVYSMEVLDVFTIFYEYIRKSWAYLSSAPVSILSSLSHAR